MMLLRTHHSLSIQELPEGWSWQWVVQEDSDTPSLGHLLPDDPRIDFSYNGAHFGPATTRNLALVRARGAITRNLDDDDELSPDALARDIEMFQKHPNVAWVTSEASDVAHGTIHPHPTPFPEGLVPIDGLRETWLRMPEKVPPVHPATLCVRTEHLRAMGGWMALPFSEDTALLMSISSRFPGYHGRHVSLFYHRSEIQISNNEGLRTRDSKSTRAAAIVQRLRAMDEVMGVPTP
jgi:glycosyltransferase involved in cell wall biosynthesis